MSITIKPVRFTENDFMTQPVAVTAGDKTAVSEAAYLAGICEKVYFITKDNTLPKELDGIEKIVLKANSQITALKGEKKLEALTVENIATKEQEELTVSALFTAVGHDPETAPLAGLPVLDDNGAVVAEKDGSTAIPGLFAAGDVVKGAVRQIVFAASAGMQAFLSARKYLRTL